MTQPPSPSGPPDPNAQPGYVPPAQPGYIPQQQPPQPGYQAPPPGYPPAGGAYPPPAPAAPPPGYASSEEKTWALVSTFGAALGAFISGGVLSVVGPLIAYLVKGKDSANVKAHSSNALNFFIPVAGAALVIWVLRVCIGVADLGIIGTLVSLVLLLAGLAVWIGGTVFGIIAGVKANEGQLYKYPFSISIIK